MIKITSLNNQLRFMTVICSVTDYQYNCPSKVINHVTKYKSYLPSSASGQEINPFRS